MKIILSFIVMIICTVIANLFMKMGATGMDASTSGFLSRLFSWRILVGLSFFGAAAMIYLVILSWVPLSVAQSFAAAQFVAVIFSSWLILSEPIAIGQLIGMCMITFGIVVVGWFTK